MASAAVLSSGAAVSPATPRFDFYQTETALTVSIFIKSASTDSLSVDIAERSICVKATSSTTGSEYVLIIDPLFSAVDATSSSYKVLSTKIDVILHKANPGIRWNQLQASGSTSDAAVISAATPTYAASQAAQHHRRNESPPPRPRSKWDTLKIDDDDPTSSSAGTASAELGANSSGGDAGEADINKFFQKLYADADDDTKRAMMKSYQESGGTTLSTDWSKVGKEPVKTHPPEGMEAKQW
ncbi:related to SGT1 - subunit of SCF ubiquitin ligase complex [Melanopsichium pennsylvanicum]|uniref:Related to SGT1 - subunit of SCF ubiquitin ligase complex n=2 Tax=Melanopsichium pennsylvanicum TaxID=63383 RepID=A0AAJ4XH43_9BASI|nr:related to SGT1-subunit of SCF ubiquitin ligase complex [Melanopsichium pennsylvanicum 4]SNX81936.1 related to SGT1 - subunit of SCF ubiquitin ligase complex [Melanopsichium pennsylvanicum]